jgi:hypothetical protein
MLLLAACVDSTPAEQLQADSEQPIIDEEPEIPAQEEQEEIEEPEPSPELSLHNVKALELLGYIIDEDGNIKTYSENWEICEPDTFREYMFGTWEGEMWDYENGGYKYYFVLDDTEDTAFINLKRANNYYRYGDTIIFLCSDYQTGSEILWLDINEPDILYSEWVNGGDELGYIFMNLSDKIYPLDPNHQISFLTRTDAPIAEPDNNFMSRLRLHEIMRDYGIDSHMIFNIEYMMYIEDHPRFNPEQPAFFQMNGGFGTFPIYLISEGPGKLVFKSRLMYGYGFSFIEDVIYTIEKINDVWERTVEFDLEKIAAARAELIDYFETYNHSYNW